VFEAGRDIEPGSSSDYDESMTIEQLQQMHRSRPFQPFDPHLADGRTLPVEHPEFLAQAPAWRTIAVGHANRVMEIVDLLLVVSLKPRANGVPQS
jgi:hypothetical protein